MGPTEPDGIRRGEGTDGKDGQSAGDARAGIKRRRSAGCGIPGCPRSDGPLDGCAGLRVSRSRNRRRGGGKCVPSASGRGTGALAGRRAAGATGARDGGWSAAEWLGSAGPRWTSTPDGWTRTRKLLAGQAILLVNPPTRSFFTSSHRPQLPAHTVRVEGSHGVRPCLPVLGSSRLNRSTASSHNRARNARRSAVRPLLADTAHGVSRISAQVIYQNAAAKAGRRSWCSSRSVPGPQ